MEKSRISRRGMLKGAAAALLALDGSVSAVSSAAAAEQLPLVQKTPVIGSKNVTGQKVEGSVAKVYFSPVIDAASLIKLYNLVNEEIYGKVAIKLHTGEPHGPIFFLVTWFRLCKRPFRTARSLKRIPCTAAEDKILPTIERPLKLTAGLSARSISWMSTVMSICRFVTDSTLKKSQWAKALSITTLCWC